MTKEVERRTVMLLAAETGLDQRTVERAIKNGVDSLRAHVDRERLRAAAKKLKVNLS